MFALDVANLGYIFAAVGLLAGIGGGIAAFRKAGPESSQILVDAAKDVVFIQKDVMEDVRAELSVQQTERSKLQQRVEELETQLLDHGIRITREEKRNTRLELLERESVRRAKAHGISREEEHDDKVGQE